MRFKNLSSRWMVVEDAGGGAEDPRALVRVRVEHDAREVERGDPLLERAGLAADRGEGEVEGDVAGVTGHGGHGSAGPVRPVISADPPAPGPDAT